MIHGITPDRHYMLPSPRAHLVVHEGFEGSDALVLDSPQHGIFALEVANTALLENVEKEVQSIVLAKLLHPTEGRGERTSRNPRGHGRMVLTSGHWWRGTL